MLIDRWLQLAVADAEARSLPELRPLLESLATSLAALRAADWNRRADADIVPEPVHAAMPPATVQALAAADAPLPAAGTPAGARPTPPGIRELARRLRSGEITATALLQDALEAIDREQPRLNAFITVTRDVALAQAAAADRALALAEPSPLLLGIPISLKDLIDMAGVPTTAGSAVRARLVATHDAAVTQRLRATGAVLVGKCNLHEFAFGTTNEDSAVGPARHPLDPSRSPGGSSGGSAAAVLAGLCIASIGTDTGGSIRIPSAACGLVGLKPTFGSIPTDGVVPLAPSLDHVGPIARSVDDAAIVLDALRGYPHPTEHPIGHDLSPRALRVGVPRRYFFDVLDEDVRAAFETAVRLLASAGATVEEVDIPHAPLTAPVYLATVLGEAAAFHADTLERRPRDYTPPVRIRLEMCRYLPAEDYLRAQAGRRALRAEVDAALDGRHALLLPALAITAPPLGAPVVRVGTIDAPVRNITLRLTQLFNLTGHPAVSLPCGVSAAGLPVGAQLVGRLHQARDLLRVAGCCERVWLGSGV